MRCGIICLSLIERNLFSYILFSLSLLTSEKSLGLFLIFFALEWIWGNLAKNWKKLTPYVLVSIVLIVFYATRVNLRTESISGPSGLNNPLIQIPAAVSTYLSLLVWPKNLTLYHGWFVFSTISYIFRLVITFSFLVITFFLFCGPSSYFNSFESGLNCSRTVFLSCINRDIRTFKELLAPMKEGDWG